MRYIGKGNITKINIVIPLIFEMYTGVKYMALEPMSDEEKRYIEDLAHKVLVGHYPNPHTY